MRVQLIQPSIRPYATNSRTGAYAPIGLLSIATYILQECSQVTVEILDGELISDEEIIFRLDADIVGISTNTVNYPQAIKIAKAAKKRGSRVVLGGVYASALPEVILKKRNKIIDTLVVGYGEKPMEEIIRGRSDRLIINHKPGFYVLPYPDRNIIDLEEYLRIFQNNHPTWNYRGTNIFTNVGCKWREKLGGGCIFCSRSGTKTAKKHPYTIWQEVRELFENYGVDYLVDFSDSILQDLDWLQEVVNAKPKDLNAYWHVFARMDEIKRETLMLLKRLPCVHIFVGIESGDPHVFKASRKGGGSPKRSLEIARLLNTYRIGLTPSYVIGLPNETEESLQRTFEHACQLKEITDLEEIFCSELIPFPGSLAFDMLRKRKNFDTDMFDIDDLKRWWAESIVKVPFELLKEYSKKILGLGKYKITISRKSDITNTLESPNRITSIV